CCSVELIKHGSSPTRLSWSSSGRRSEWLAFAAVKVILEWFRHEFEGRSGDNSNAESGCQEISWAAADMGHGVAVPRSRHLDRGRVFGSSRRHAGRIYEWPRGGAADAVRIPPGHCWKYLRRIAG